MPFDDQLVKPRPGHGLQAMMLRWEELQPVNAVHVAWLRDSFSVSQIETAAARVFERLPQASQPCAKRSAREQGRLFEFHDHVALGDWRAHLEQVVTRELNTPFEDGRTPFRVCVIDVRGQGQFVILAYRHVVADARAVALLLHEIIGQLSDPKSRNSGIEVLVGGQSLCELFPAEFSRRRVPAVAWHMASEVWKSRRCVRLTPIDSDDLGMDFRVHQTALSLTVLKSRCRHLHATVNDLVLASVLEWFASWLPDRRDARRDLAVATLVDLSKRGDVAQPLAFGQFLSQFVVRAPVTADFTFEEIVRLVSQQTASQKQVRPLICNSISFGLLARLWDLLPLIRKPEHLPAVFPLLAGVSNVNLSGIGGRNEMPPLVRSYFRGTCVTNLLPMMLSLTSLRGSVSLTTTHRPVFFSAEQMVNLAGHVGRRLFDEAADADRPRIVKRAA